MRDFKGMKRQRGRNRKTGSGRGGNNNPTPNPTGPGTPGPREIKVRCNAKTVYGQCSWADASRRRRVMAELTRKRTYSGSCAPCSLPPVVRDRQRELAGQGFDIDFEDETGAQAAAIMAAEKVEADRVAQIEARQRENEERQNGGSNDRQNDRPGDQPRREWRDRDDQPRAEREPREPREPRPEGEATTNADGSRRETRRERWERRQQERGARFDRWGRAPPDGSPPASRSRRPPRPRRRPTPGKDDVARAERRPRRYAEVATRRPSPAGS